MALKGGIASKYRKAGQTGVYDAFTKRLAVHFRKWRSLRFARGPRMMRPPRAMPKRANEAGSGVAVTEANTTSPVGLRSLTAKPPIGKYCTEKRGSGDTSSSELKVISISVEPI